MSAKCAACVKKKIVKVPKNEFAVTFGRSETAIPGYIDLIQDLAIYQQTEKLNPEKAVLPTELFDPLRCREYGQAGRNPRIAKLEQGAGARRFQNHVVATPSHVSKSRHCESVRIAELRRLRPIIGSLRFDDDQVLAIPRVPEAILHQAVPRQPPNQSINLFVNVPASGRKRS